MAVKTGTAVGDYLSPHIKDTEWKCRVSNTIKYDETELKMLEQARTDFGASAMVIESGFRTDAYNKSIKGASDSPHTKGYAADVRFIKDGKLIPTEVVCCHAQDIGFKGVAICRGTGVNAHLDMYPRIYRGDERKGNYGNNIKGNDWYKETGLSIVDVQKYLVSATPVAEKEEDEEMKYYETINDVPTSYRPTIQKMVDAGYISGEGKKSDDTLILNVSEDLCRMATIFWREDPQYETVADVPTSYRPSIQKLIDKGKLAGEGKKADGTLILNISEDFCKQVTVNDRTGLYD